MESYLHRGRSRDGSPGIKISTPNRTPSPQLPLGSTSARARSNSRGPRIPGFGSGAVESVLREELTSAHADASNLRQEVMRLKIQLQQEKMARKELLAKIPPETVHSNQDGVQEGQSSLEQLATRLRFVEAENEDLVTQLERVGHERLASDALRLECQVLRRAALHGHHRAEALLQETTAEIRSLQSKVQKLELELKESQEEAAEAATHRREAEAAAAAAAGAPAAAAAAEARAAEAAARAAAAEAEAAGARREARALEARWRRGAADLMAQRAAAERAEAEVTALRKQLLLADAEKR